jgi:hypothetical protein
VQVDNQLKVVLGGPCNGFREIGQLAANIRLAGSNFEGPVADGQAYMVQTCGMSKKNAGQEYGLDDLPGSCDGREVGLGDPCIPVGLEGRLGRGFRL